MCFVIDLISTIWIGYINPFINQQWSNIEFWRISTLALLSLLLLIYSFKNKIIKLYSKSSLVSHDSNIYSQFDNILPERKLNEILDRLNCNQSIHDENDYKFIIYLRNYEEESNKYIIRKIEKAHKNFANTLLKLKNFMIISFFVIQNDYEYYMLPELKYNNPKRYLAKYNELLIYIYEVEKSYKRYRKIIKERLLI